MKYIRYVIFLIVAVIVVWIVVEYHPTNPGPTSAATNTVAAMASSTAAALAINSNLPMEIISIGPTTLQVEIASTDAEREQGLSDRTSLVPGHGMLFVFDPPKDVSFWMKDMQFSLDMVFADADGVITKIDTNVTPASYPELFPSGSPIMYVLEIPAGYAAAHGIAIGQKIVVQ